MANRTIIVLANESIINSIVKDTFTMGSFAAILWFNHAVLSGNWFIDTLFILLCMGWLLGRNSKTFNKFETVQEAIKFLEGLK